MKRALEHLAGLTVGGKYHLESMVGEGGMAYVYRGVHTDFNHPIAFKVLFSHLAKKDDVRERFKREARLQFCLQHPNIVRVIDMIEEEGLLGIVLDWVDGNDLDHFLKHLERPVLLAEIRRLFVPVLEAVAYAHDQQVVHRDLKPSNILLAGAPGEESPKVMDFGIAKSLGEDNFKTRTGILVGTPYYISPEQAQGMKNIDHRADIYSLGVTLFQMLAGRLPFEGNNALEVVTKHCLHQVPSVHIFRPDLPPALGDIIAQAMAKDPASRFHSARAFARALLPHLPSLESALASSDDLLVSEPPELQTPRTSPHSTALGQPPVPEGWRSPSAASLAPMPGTPAMGSPAVDDDRTRFTWEYSDDDLPASASASLAGGTALGKPPLPTGEDWGPYASAPGIKGGVESERDVTPPYARPLPMAAPSSAQPMAAPFSPTPRLPMDSAATQFNSWQAAEDGAGESGAGSASPRRTMWAMGGTLMLLLLAGVAMYAWRAQSSEPTASPSHPATRSAPQSSQRALTPSIRRGIPPSSPTRRMVAAVTPQPLHVGAVAPSPRSRRPAARPVRRSAPVARRRKVRRRRTAKRRTVSWSACLSCVSRRFRALENDAMLGHLGDTAGVCNQNDFLSIGRRCARVCGRRYGLYCRAVMKASSGSCRRWIGERRWLRSRLRLYRVSVTPAAIARCRKGW